MVKLGISGISGRMGQRILYFANQEKDCSVVVGFEKKGHADIGNKEPVFITDDLSKASNCDCLIDFTTPEATVEHLSYMAKAKRAIVIGTTGLSDSQISQIKDVARVVPVVFSPNMSVGVNLLFKLLSEAAKVLHGYRVDVTEAHHIHKKDAPSGTAKKIADVINAQGFSLKYEDVGVVREGEIVGDHRVVFESDVDRIELSHSAKTRDIFAQGAVRAAKWVSNKPSGLYTMNDVLGI
jgi:4-hydroxy-tetrahydrodipicolinate reductase